MLSLAFILGITFGYYSRLSECKKVVVAQSNAALPTTIVLSDNSDDEIRAYYQGLNSLSESERQGQNLLKNLKPILSNGQIMYSYDTNNGKAIWQMYEIIDRDWDKSPADQITYGTYDANTNTITGYQYGTSNSTTKNDPYVRALYVDRSVDNPMKAWGNHDQKYGGINREHIWPKSHGFDEVDGSNSDGARGDPMHLWAADGYTNNIHSNYFYGYVDTTKDYVDCQTKISYSVGNYRGTSKALGTGTVFEPQDSDKGDIARAVFYMVARYNNLAGATSGIDANEPNLTLENGLTGNNATGTSTPTQAYSLGILQDLLEWNKLDPVDDFEIHRNNLCFNNYTKNRNPFIDFPEWADYIWGTSVDGTYDSTGTGSANPQSDKINGGTRLLSASKLSMEVGNSVDVTIEVDEEVAITNSDEEIVSIERNDKTLTISALKEGKTTITAKATINAEEVTQKLEITVKGAGGSGETSESDSSDSSGDKPSGEGFKLDTKMIIIIGAAALVLIIILVIVFASLSKKQKKKVIKTAKKVVKKSSSNSSKSKKK